MNNPFHNKTNYAIAIIMIMAGTIMGAAFSCASIVSGHAMSDRWTLTPREERASGEPRKIPRATQQSGYLPKNVSEGYAIVCGINNYPNPDNDLKCCDADANSVESLATSYFMIPSSHVVELLDSSATISAISNAITSTAAKMDKNDYLLFFYSGHGAAAENITQHAWSVNSPHPYPDNYDNYWHFSCPGAEEMRVHFTEISTEYSYDYVYVGDNHDTYYYYDYFTGYYSDVTSNWVNTNDIYVELYSDYVNTDWGFQVNYVEVMTWAMPCQILPYDFVTAGTSITGIDGPTLNTLFSSVPGTTIALFDSCFSGGIGDAMQAPNRYIMSASNNNETSLEDPSGLKHGVFSNYFIKAWNQFDSGNAGGVSFEQVFPWISSQSISESNFLGEVQHPQQFDGTPGNLVLRPTPSINSCSFNSNGSTVLNYTLNGLGYGELFCSYYDQVHHSYAVRWNATALQPSQLAKIITINPPVGNFTPTAISVILKAKYGTFVQTANYCINVTGNTPFSSTVDSDHDGLTDAQELHFGSNPWVVDTDGDGFNDSTEYRNGFSPFINDWNGDYDGDGMPNWWEIKYSFNPLVNDSGGDADHDGLINLQEYLYGTNPRDPDTDHDGLNDYQEIMIYHTNPLNPDTDGDGFSDGIEVAWHSDPLNPGDTPMLHVFALVMAFALLFVTLISAKGIAKKHPYPRKGTHGPRPVENSIPVKELRRRSFTPPSRQAPSYTPTWRQAPGVTPVRVPFSPYGGTLARQPLIGLPPLPPDLQRKLNAMTPLEREIFTKVLRQAFLQRITGPQPLPVAKSPAIRRRFCIRCGTPVVGNRCPKCGYVFSPI